MNSTIEVTCAVCGLHVITVPARDGLYIISCPNKKSIFSQYKYTRIKIEKDGSVSARVSDSTGRTGTYD